MATMPLKNVQESIKFYQQMALIQWDLVKSCLTNRSKKWGEQGAGEWEPSVNDSGSTVLPTRGGTTEMEFRVISGWEMIQMRIPVSAESVD